MGRIIHAIARGSVNPTSNESGLSFPHGNLSSERNIFIMSNTSFVLEGKIPVVRRSHFICVGLFIVFSALFPLDEYVGNLIGFGGHKITSYAFFGIMILFAGIYLPQLRQNLVMYVALVFLGIYLASYFFSPQNYRTNNWYAYQFAFIFAGLCIGSTYYSVLKASLQKEVQVFLVRLIYGSSILVFFASVWIMFKGEVSFLQMIENWDANGFIFNFMEFGLEKQALGNLLAILYLGTFYLYPPKSFQKKIIFTMLLVTLSYSWGIRDIWFGLIPVIFLYFPKLRFLMIPSLVGSFLIVFYLMVGDWFVIFGPAHWDVRWAIYKNLFEIVTEFPFGVGLGGYHHYMSVNWDQILPNFGAQYENNEMIAPESDFVYLMGSLGLFLGAIHYCVQIYILLKLCKYYPNLSPLNKFFSAIYVFYFFSGIFQDNMFSLEFWILMGLVLGVITFVEHKTLRDMSVSTLQNHNNDLNLIPVPNFNV